MAPNETSRAAPRLPEGQRAREVSFSFVRPRSRDVMRCVFFIHRVTINLKRSPRAGDFRRSNGLLPTRVRTGAGFERRRRLGSVVRGIRIQLAGTSSSASSANMASSTAAAVASLGLFLLWAAILEFFFSFTFRILRSSLSLTRSMAA